MKKSFWILAISAATFLISCTPEPDACFEISSNELFIDEEFTYTDCSIDAALYNVNFGDGNNISRGSGTYAYAKEGTFQINFTAFDKSGKKSSKVSKSVTVTKSTEQQLAGTKASDNELVWNLTVSGSHDYLTSSNYSFNYSSTTYTDNEAITFNVDGTYTRNYGSPTSGTWSFSEGYNDLVLDLGTPDWFSAKIVEFTDTKLRLEKTVFVEVGINRKLHWIFNRN